MQRRYAKGVERNAGWFITLFLGVYSLLSDIIDMYLMVQACHSGYGKVDEDAVYECTGSPHPKQIEEIVLSMMNEEFQTSFKS